jgi:hypothetical protein
MPLVVGCAKAQAYKRQFSTKDHRLQSRLTSSEVLFVVDEVALGQVLLELFGFSQLISFVP